MEDPCETCLVNACCEIRKSARFYQSKCPKYEIYVTKRMLDECNSLDSFAYLNLTNRLKELGVDY